MKFFLEVFEFSNKGGIGVCEWVSGDNTSTNFVVETEIFVGVSSKVTFDIRRSSGLILWSTSGVSPILSDDFAIFGFFVDSYKWSVFVVAKENFCEDVDCFLIGFLSFFVKTNDLSLYGDLVIIAFIGLLTDLNIAFPVPLLVNLILSHFYFVFLDNLCLKIKMKMAFTAVGLAKYSQEIAK